MKKLFAMLTMLAMLVCAAPAFSQKDSCPSLTESQQTFEEIIGTQFELINTAQAGTYDPLFNKEDNSGTEGPGIMTMVLFFEPKDKDSCYDKVMVFFRQQDGSLMAMATGLKYGKLILYYLDEKGEWVLWKPILDIPPVKGHSQI